MKNLTTKIKIFVSIIISLFIVLSISGKTGINYSWAWLKNMINPPKIISSIKIDQSKILTDINPRDSFQMVSVEFAPTPSPTDIPLVPTQLPTRHIQQNYILPTRKFIPPTLVPTSTPIPPTSTLKKIGDLPLSEPLKQPYYGVPSSICYKPKYFIRYYGGNLTPDSCYSNIRANVEANLVKVNLLGRSVQVHKDAAPYFQAVADELAKYQKDSTTFEFPSKTYKIRTMGTYTFKCNTAQSSGNLMDTCSKNCVIGDHAFGIAIDINWDENCWGCNNYDMPPEIVNAFERWGFRWGGRYNLPVFGKATIDAMHFEYMYDLCKGL